MPPASEVRHQTRRPRRGSCALPATPFVSPAGRVGRRSPVRRGLGSLGAASWPSGGRPSSWPGGRRLGGVSGDLPRSAGRERLPIGRSSWVRGVSLGLTSRCSGPRPPWRLMCEVGGRPGPLSLGVRRRGHRPLADGSRSCDGAVSAAMRRLGGLPRRRVVSISRAARPSCGLPRRCVVSASLVVRSRRSTPNLALQRTRPRGASRGAVSVVVAGPLSFVVRFHQRRSFPGTHICLW